MRWIAAGTLCVAISAPAAGQQKVVKKADPETPASAKASLLTWGEEARTHVSSTRIVRGVVRVDMESLKTAVAKAGYVHVRVDVQENIYGPQASAAKFRVFVPKTGVPNKRWEWSSKDVAAWQDQDCVVFLTTSEGKYYLASDVASQAVVAASRYAIIRIRHREALHGTLLATPLRQDRQREKAVARLMRRMCGGKELQLETFSELEGLGREAVVEIVAAMDVRRKLPVAGITLRNKAKDRFEAVRHYSPQLAVDAVAAILNQTNGESFGFIYSGAAEEERAACVRAWTLYAHYVLAGRAAKKAQGQLQKGN